MKGINLNSILSKVSNNHQRYKAFTLAEVIIVLGIIGIVAEMTIPTLIQNVHDMQYKAAYKKAYSDISQAFEQAIFEKTLTPRTTKFDEIATVSEWAVMKSAFKVTTDCNTYSDLNKCWADGDKINNNQYPNSSSSLSFVDNSGRSWAQYWYMENDYLVDTNGKKLPNRFGKDRWIFTLKNADGTRTTVGYPAKVGNLTGDYKDYNAMYCQYPPCYYYSWLYN